MLKTQNESRRNGCHAADVLQIQAQHVTDGKGGGIIDQCRQNGVREIPVFLQKGNGNEGMIFSPFENDKRIAGNDTDAEPDQRMPIHPVQRQYESEYGNDEKKITVKIEGTIRLVFPFFFNPEKHDNQSESREDEIENE